jgi:transposase
MRQIEFLDSEIAEVDRLIAQQTLPVGRRAASADRAGRQGGLRGDILGRDRDIRRFGTSRQLVAYRGLDPKVRQSGSEPARLGRISKQGSPRARWALVEATHSVILQPGPLRAFHQRIRARRGYQIATVAAARKLACLFWCLLARDENYAHAQPSLTAKKLRKLELIAGAKRFDRSAAGIWTANRAVRKAEKRLAQQAEVSYVRMVRDWQATHRRKWARARHRSAHKSALEGHSRAADSKLLTPALRYVSHPRPTTTYRSQSTPTTRRRSPARK